MGIKKRRMKTELTEAAIQRRLSGFLSSVRYDIDNLYVFRWESDKLIKTRSGYYYEFEIKISKSDFKNDFKHKTDKHHLLKAMLTGEKHTLTFYREWEWNKNRYISFEAFERDMQHPCHFVEKQKKPNYFYYAVPENMIAVEDVPEYAGLIYVTEDGWLKTVKKAPLLHKEKYTDEQLGLGEKFYYNMVHWRNISHNYWRDIQSSRDRLRKELEAKGHDRTWEDMKRDLETTESIKEDYKRDLERYRRDANWNGFERRQLIMEIRKHDPKFDVFEFDKRIDEMYNERYNQK
jgi:hypothetical protein